MRELDHILALSSFPSGLRLVIPSRVYFPSSRACFAWECRPCPVPRLVTLLRLSRVFILTSATCSSSSESRFHGGCQSLWTVMCHPFSCMKPSLYHFVHVTWLLIWNSHHYSVRDRCWLFTVLSDEWILLCLRRLLKSSYKTNCNVLMHLGIGMKQKQTRIGILLFVWDIELKPTWLYWLQQQQIAAGMYIYSILYIRSIKKSENQVLLLMVQSREPAFFSLESQKVFLCFFPFHHIMRGITSIL